jgi:hypothetical protein
MVVYFGFQTRNRNTREDCGHIVDSGQSIYNKQQRILFVNTKSKIIKIVIQFQKIPLQANVAIFLASFPP